MMSASDCVFFFPWGYFNSEFYYEIICVEYYFRVQSLADQSAGSSMPIALSKNTHYINNKNKFKCLSRLTCCVTMET